MASSFYSCFIAEHHSKIKINTKCKKRIPTNPARIPAPTDGLCTISHPPFLTPAAHSEHLLTTSMSPVSGDHCPRVHKAGKTSPSRLGERVATIGATILKWMTPKMTLSCPPGEICPHGVRIIKREAQERALWTLVEKRTQLVTDTGTGCLHMCQGTSAWSREGLGGRAVVWGNQR